MNKENNYMSPETEEFALGIDTSLMAFSNGAPDVDITLDTEDDTFA